MSNGTSHAEHYPGPLHKPPVKTGRRVRITRRTRITRSCSTISTTWRSRLEASTLGMWVFLVTEIMFFGGLFMAYLVYRHAEPMAFQEASAHLNIWLGRGEHDRADRQLAHHGARGPVRANQRAAENTGLLARVDDDPRRCVPWRQGDRVHRQVHPPSGAWPELPVAWASIRRVPRSSTRSISA